VPSFQNALAYFAALVSYARKMFMKSPPGVALRAALSVRAGAAAGIVSPLSPDAPALPVQLPGRARRSLSPVVGALDQPGGGELLGSGADVIKLFYGAVSYDFSSIKK
jgi:hypothetical protein